MEKLRHEIRQIKRHHLEYYESHMTLVEQFIDEKPDISIETCKAIIEGVSKLSLHLLTQEPLHSLNDKGFQTLYKEALACLWEGAGHFDSDLAKRLGSLVHYLGELRNGHCDIGHGRASLKDQINDPDFTEMIIGMTDSMCVYMLRRLDKLVDREIEYDDNPAFNEILDIEMPLDGRVLYSKALYEQERETYMVRLGDYNIEMEIEEI